MKRGRSRETPGGGIQFRGVERWRATLIRWFTRPGMAFALIAGVVFSVIGDDPGFTVVVHSAAFAALLVVDLLLRSGRMRLAGAVLLTLFWVVFTAACWRNGGVASASMAGYLVLVFVGGFLLDERAALLTFFAGCGAGVLLAWGETSGWIEPLGVVSPWVRLATWTLYLTITVTLMIGTLRGFRRARASKGGLSDLVAGVEARAVSRDAAHDLMQRMSDPVLVVGARDEIVDANDPAGALLRMGRDELIGLRMQDLARDWTSSDELDVHAGARGLEVQWRTGDGGAVLVSPSFAPLEDARGRRIGVVIVAHDLTARVQLEKELEEARRRAEAGSRAKSDFLARMSHEIRTPMNAVIGISDLLLETRLEVDQRELVETVRSSGEVLLNLVEDILDFSRIEAGKLVVQRAVFDVWDLAFEAADLVSRTAHEKGLELIVDVDPGVPYEVVGDGARLRQVAINFLSNAVKFTPRGTVALRVSFASGALKIAVEDSGPGIADKDLGALFQPFERRAGEVSPGAGLGLAIVRQLVELMKGELEVESVPGQGSVFTATVPVTAVPAESPPPQGDVAVLHSREEVAEALVRMLGAFGLRGRVVTGQDLARLDQDVLGIVVDVASVTSADAEVGDVLRKLTGEDERPRIVLLAKGGANPPSTEDGWTADAVIQEPGDPRAILRVLNPEEEATEGRRKLAVTATILLAEDNPINQMVTSRILESEGYRIVVANDGKEAVELAPSIPDLGLALVDLHMPRLDGEATIRQLCRDFPNLPVVALTAAATRDERQRCANAGAVDILHKPIRANDLRRAVRRILSGESVGMPPAGHEDAEELPRIDVEVVRALRQMSDLGPGFLEEVVAVFERELAKRCGELREALASNDLAEVENVAHTLKGGAGTVGAARLAAWARQLEEGAREGRIDAAVLEGFEREAETVAPLVRETLLGSV